ncbi:MAG: outer membrane beta-barrel protein [Burkholderiales bacterium]
MRFKKNSILLAAGMLAAGAALAQTSPVRPSYQYPGSPGATRGPAAVQLGSSPVFVAPWASVAFGNDSNVNLASANEIDSAYAIYGAGIHADARDSNSVFQLGLLGSHGRYSDSSADNYTDASARASYDVALTSRNFVRVGWDYVRGHDPRGSTDRTAAENPDKYYLSTPGIVYAHGAPDAKGRLELFASRAARRYRNNRDLTVGSDRNVKDYGGAFYWRVMPKTQLIAEARGADIDYLLDDSPFSGRETRFLLGATWDATAATSGTVKLGRLEKRFSSGLPAFKGTTWEGMVTWLPRSYSKFDLYSSRQPVESTGLGNFILSDATGLVWSHAWNSFFVTEASARFQRDRYKGFDRDDDLTMLGVKATYRFRRWMSLGAEYQHTNRDSNIGVYEYDKNLWLLSATLSM